MSRFKIELLLLLFQYQAFQQSVLARNQPNFPEEEDSPKKTFNVCIITQVNIQNRKMHNINIGFYIGLDWILSQKNSLKNMKKKI